MSWSRRNFLITAGLGTAASTVVHLGSSPSNAQTSDEVYPSTFSFKGWDDVRASFNLDPDYIHLAGMLLAAHPAPVRAAIQQHRMGLDVNPVHYLDETGTQSIVEVCQHVAEYLGVDPQDIALTDSTTMGTALVINGLKIRPEQEMLTTEFDYYSTHTSLEYKAARSGATVRKIPLYGDIQTVSIDEMVDTLISNVRPETRLVTATWVHSNTGLKVPVAQIGEKLARINATRTEDNRVLFFVDGVHGLGVENASLVDLNCDFFVAGTHKWIFAPRGTGLIWGNPQTQDAVTPTIPTFSRRDGWGGWMTPGGFKAFEHQWAIAAAFDFHQQIGKKSVTKRLHQLSRQLKKGLEKMKHVKLYTPMDQDLSAAIVCFDVEGMRPKQVVQQLRSSHIIGSTTPYARSYARLTPSVFNTPEEIDLTLKRIRELA